MRDEKKLLISIRPVYVEKILAGTKRVELRRSCPRMASGGTMLIYATSPKKTLVAAARVARVQVESPETLWRSVKKVSGVTLQEFEAYFDGAKQAVGLWLDQVAPLSRPVPLEKLRQRWPGFRPPQSFCYVTQDQVQKLPELTNFSQSCEGAK